MVPWKLVLIGPAPHYEGPVYTTEAIYDVVLVALEKDQGLPSRLGFKFRLCPYRQCDLRQVI